MSEQPQKQSLDAILSALRYLRAHPDSLLIPSIAADLASIGDQLTRIVDDEKERHAAAARNFMVNSRRIKNDYSTTSINGLRSAYNYFRSRNREIPQALHQRLIEHFPGYDAATQTFIGHRTRKPRRYSNRTEEPDFSKLDKKALRQSYKYYTQRGKELPASLHAALIAKFPGYDAATQKFTGYKPEHDFSKSSKRILRQGYKYYTSRGKELPASLHAALIANFPAYDPETQRFSAKDAQHDFSKSSKLTLRSMYRYYTSRNMELPLSLRQALIDNFPGYDPENNRFTQGPAKRAVAATSKSHQVTTTPIKSEVSRSDATVQTQKPVIAANTNTPAVAATPVVPDEISAQVHLISVKSGTGKHSLYFRDNKLLQGADDPFELVLFDAKTQTAVIRKVMTNTHHKLFIINCKQGKVLEHMRMGAREIKYVPELHQLWAREVQESIMRYMVFTPNRTLEIRSLPPKDALSVRARQFIKETIIIDKNGNVSTYPLVQLSVKKKMQASQKTKTIAPQSAQTVKTEKTNRSKQTAPAKETAPTAPTKAMVTQPGKSATVASTTTTTVATTPVAKPSVTTTPAKSTIATQPHAKPVDAPYKKPVVANTQADKIEHPVKAIPRAPQPATPAPAKPVVAPITTVTPAAPATIAATPVDTTTVVSEPRQILKATLKPIKTTLEGTYYDVYVNGTRILKKHFGTHIETFLDGTVLAVHGIDTQNQSLPRSPLWQVFNTDLQPRTFTQKNLFTNTSIYIKNITQSANQINLHLSNKVVMILELTRELKKAKNKQFEIVASKQTQK